jgi:hypothetical protein
MNGAPVAPCDIRSKQDFRSLGYLGILKLFDPTFFAAQIFAQRTDSHYLLFQTTVMGKNSSGNTFIPVHCTALHCTALH